MLTRLFDALFHRRQEAHPADLHPGEEFDEYTQSWVREGWPAERQALADAEFQRWRRGERRGGTCLDCGQPTDDHPMPERLWRRGPDLCAQVRKH